MKDQIMLLVPLTTLFSPQEMACDFERKFTIGLSKNTLISSLTSAVELANFNAPF